MIFRLAALLATLTSTICLANISDLGLSSVIDTLSRPRSLTAFTTPTSQGSCTGTMIEQLPNNVATAGPLIQRWVADSRCASIRWVSVSSRCQGATLRFWVASDALSIPGPQGPVRLPVSARVAQELSDRMGWIMPTPKIIDLIHEQAEVRITPCARTNPQGRNSRQATLEHSRCIQNKIATQRERQPALPDSPLVDNVGKFWVLTDRLTSPSARRSSAAANYGWYTSEAPGRSVYGNYRMYQEVGFAHNTTYTDYSQVMRPIRRDCRLTTVVNGTPQERDCDLTEIMRDPALSCLVSTEGPLRTLRQP